MSLKLCTEVIYPQKQIDGMKKASWKSHAEPDLKSWVWEKIKSLLSLSFFSAWPESFLVLGNSHDPVNMLNDVCKEVYVCPSGAWEVLSIICFARHTVLNPKYPEISCIGHLRTCCWPADILHLITFDLQMHCYWFQEFIFSVYILKLV